MGTAAQTEPPATITGKRSTGSFKLAATKCCTHAKKQTTAYFKEVKKKEPFTLWWERWKGLLNTPPCF